MLQPTITTTKDYVIFKVPRAMLAREAESEKDEVRKLIDAGLKDIKEGRVSGPFTSAAALIKSLHRGARRLRSHATKQA